MPKRNRTKLTKIESLFHLVTTSFTKRRAHQSQHLVCRTQLFGDAFSQHLVKIHARWNYGRQSTIYKNGFKTTATTHCYIRILQSKININKVAKEHNRIVSSASLDGVISVEKSEKLARQDPCHVVWWTQAEMPSQLIHSLSLSFSRCCGWVCVCFRHILHAHEFTFRTF